MNTLFRWAAENRFRTVIAGVVKGNARALKFYVRLGFVPADDRFPPDPGDVVLVRQIESEPSQ
jgi:RimJ/RimL family protein N-acetyltransferase